MTHVLEMSTDRDILATTLHASWNPISARYHWADLQRVGGQRLPNNATLVVIAHGVTRGTVQEIGNATPGTIDITPAGFHDIIYRNMARGANPAAIYLSTCSPGIAQFTAGVRNAANQNGVLNHTYLFGHSDPAAGPVPAHGTIGWTQIF
jgi:hypothetical protein